MYLSTIPLLSRSASAEIQAKKLLTKISVSVAFRSSVLLEKPAMSENNTVACISRPFTGKSLPQPSLSCPSTVKVLETRKSSRELNRYFMAVIVLVDALTDCDANESVEGRHAFCGVPFERLVGPRRLKDPTNEPRRQAAMGFRRRADDW